MAMTVENKSALEAINKILQPIGVINAAASYSEAGMIIYPHLKTIRAALEAKPALVDDRRCTCHRDDTPPTPCAQKYALGDCRAAAPVGEIEAYSIKPLKWEKGRFDTWSADCRGSYRIEKRDSGSFFWGYCWDEYYDEEQFDCDSLEDGKQQAEAHYRERVLEFLVPQPYAAGQVQTVDVEALEFIGWFVRRVDDGAIRADRCFSDFREWVEKARKIHAQGILKTNGEKQ